MIVRVLRVRVRAGRVGAFNALFRRQVALLREQDGLLYVKLARRLQPDGAEEAVLFEEWQDAASLYAWVGPNLKEPRLVPGVRELIDEVHVAHYEALSEDTETALEGDRGNDADARLPGTDDTPLDDAGADSGAKSRPGAEAS
ncbi:MAG TPA: antibiotic biosynthesis monooxygenase [Candidatus Limnocylindrales bacterium]|nr:antibiotic biosynthesis monooxygenase [Candidatus Limnocylindrales bacterium]